MGNFIKWVVGVLVGEEIFTGFLDYLNLTPTVVKKVAE